MKTENLFPNLTGCHWPRDNPHMRPRPRPRLKEVRAAGITPAGHVAGGNCPAVSRVWIRHLWTSPPTRSSFFDTGNGPVPPSQLTHGELRMIPMLAVLILGCLLLGSQGLEGAVLFLIHYDDSLDADHSLFGEPNADAAGMKLSLEGRGYPFKGVPKNRALDAGYTSSANREAVVRYSAVNLDSRRGTIEMWVKSSWASDPPRARPLLSSGPASNCQAAGRARPDPP